ncbi:hypothetical protein V8C37DRAFT_83137 [Trichoderma ceciliae]
MHVRNKKKEKRKKKRKEKKRKEKGRTPIRKKRKKTPPVLSPFTAQSRPPKQPLPSHQGFISCTLRPSKIDYLQTYKQQHTPANPLLPISLYSSFILVAVAAAAAYALCSITWHTFRIALHIAFGQDKSAAAATATTTNTCMHCVQPPAPQQDCKREKFSSQSRLEIMVQHAETHCPILILLLSLFCSLSLLSLFNRINNAFLAVINRCPFHDNNPLV